MSEVGGAFRNPGAILVLFILLVIILASGCFGGRVY